MRLRIATLAMLLLAGLGLASLAGAETVQRAGVRISLQGTIEPNRLPRDRPAPVAVKVSTAIAAPGGRIAPALRRISISINGHGRLDSTGLPVCTLSEIQPATTTRALEACGDALVGRGLFDATVAFGRQTNFPSRGEMYAFNGTYKGKPAILAHAYGTDPVPTSLTLPFVITHGKGTFGTTLTAVIPSAKDSSITGLSLNLKRIYSYRGERRSFASADCPAPPGFGGATFPFAKVSYAFLGGKKVETTLVRNCKVRR